MKDKKITTESPEATYRTGSTHPPKTRGGIIAFLLALVIFLSGISTALGLMNIRLFKKLSVLEATTPSPVAFSRGAHREAPENAVKYPLGFAGQEVTDFWQTYYHLPAGIYIVEITGDTVQDLLPGDILTQIGNVNIAGAADLDAALEQYRSGDTVNTLIYRGGNLISITLTIQED